MRVHSDRISNVSRLAIDATWLDRDTLPEASDNVPEISGEFDPDNSEDIIEYFPEDGESYEPSNELDLSRSFYPNMPENEVKNAIEHDIKTDMQTEKVTCSGRIPRPTHRTEFIYACPIIIPDMQPCVELAMALGGCGQFLCCARDVGLYFIHQQSGT